MSATISGSGITATSFSGNLIGGTVSGTTGNFSGAVNASNIIAHGNLITDNSIQGGSNGFLISPQGAFSGTGLLIYGGGECRCTATTQSTSTTTGALTVMGGAGIVGNLYSSNAFFSGTVTAATPTVSSHLTTKSYVDSAITTANAQVSTGVYGAGAFTVTGLTFVNLSKAVRYSKIGAAVIISAEFTWTSTTGTLVEADSNTSIGTPFNSTLVRSVSVTIQKNSFFSTKVGVYMEDGSSALKCRLNAADMPGYTGNTTLLFSWTFWTTP